MPVIGLRLALIVTSCVLAACAPRMNVYRISGTSTEVGSNRKRPGVYYALPRTVVTVAVPMTLKQPLDPEGTCISKVDKERLSKLGIPSTRTLTFADPTLTTRAEPDPDEMFVVEIKPRLINRMDHTLELTEQGLLTHGSGAGKNQALQLGVEVVKVAASIVARGATTYAKFDDDRCGKELAKVQASAERQSELRLAIARAAAAGQPTAALESRLANETRFFDLLVGQWFPHETRSASVVCELRPSRSNQANLKMEETLFGVVGSQPATAIRIDRDVTSAHCTAPPAFVTEKEAPSTTYAIELTHAEPSHAETLLAATHAVPKPRCWLGLVSGDRCARGLYYRVPVTASVVVKKDNPPPNPGKDATTDGGSSQTKPQPREVLEQLVPIAQLGGVVSLPPRVGNVFGGKADLYLWDATGALKKLETTDEGPPAGLLTGIDTTANAYIAADDELARLKRKKEILELKAAIEKLESGGE